MHRKKNEAGAKQGQRSRTDKTGASGNQVKAHDGRFGAVALNRKGPSVEEICSSTVLVRARWIMTNEMRTVQNKVKGDAQTRTNANYNQADAHNDRFGVETLEYERARCRRNMLK